MTLFSVCKPARVEGIVLPTSFFQFLSSLPVTTLLFSLLNVNHIWELTLSFQPVFSIFEVYASNYAFVLFSLLNTN